MYSASEKSLVRKVIKTAAPIAIDTGTLIKIRIMKPMNNKTNIINFLTLSYEMEVFQGIQGRLLLTLKKSI